MDGFSQGRMQRHPLIQGSIFSSWRLHARIISKTSHQVSLFLRLWHAHCNLDFIKTYELDVADLIPHIDLAALTSHIASRICRHIQLSCFWVSPLCMSCAVFLSLFFISACVSVVCLILVSACCRFNVCYLVEALFHFLFASHCYRMHETTFALTVTIAVTLFTHMDAFPFSESCTYYLHA